MKIRDKLKLIKYEYYYGKTEGIASFLMNTIIYTCILLSLTVTLEVSEVFNNYMCNIYPDGFTFEINGFQENEKKWLEERGFYDIVFFNEDLCGTATTKDISNIWLYKFQALFRGSDIWDEELEQMLEVVLFVGIVFMAITVILSIVLINCNSNSFLMKLEERKKYINMLLQLGMSQKNCISVFVLFFIIRGIAALTLAVCTNGVIIYFINDYIVSVMHLQKVFSIIKPIIIGLISVVSSLIMIISFQKIWREKHEF